MSSTPAFRIDVPLHEVLTGPEERRPAVEPKGMELPEVEFPQRPDGVEDYRKYNVKRGLQAWAMPYLRSRVRPDDLVPIVPYLFTEFKCNLDCHYCWSYDNQVKGMTEDVARRSIDWLHDLGSRSLALMGGEPLLRWRFVHKVTDYASKKGHFVYLPTNGRLMRPHVTDHLGDAGIATVNLAVDSVKERKELPKALDAMRDNFDYLVKRQRFYGFSIVLNINITRINIEDVKQLTEIGHDLGIVTDYHINESPMVEADHFKHYDDNSTYITPDDHSRIDDLLDWLIDKAETGGYRYVNPNQHLRDMKKLMRGDVDPWRCRAGENSLIIRTDGTLAPCFPMYSATHDWGTIENPGFEREQLDEMKKECTKHCLSTCNYILQYCYDNMRVLKWIARQAKGGFRSVDGAFE